MGLSMIFMFFFMSILYPLSLVLFNFCEVLMLVVKSEADMMTLDLKASAVTDKVKVCLWNSDPTGNIAKSFGIESQLSSIDDVTKNFNSFLSKLDPNSPDYIDLNKVTGDYLNLEMGMIGGFTDGRLKNVTIEVTDQDLKNPYLAIMDLSSYTDKNTTTRNGASVNNVGCDIVNDYFVYSALDCPSSRTIWTNSSVATANLGNPTCIPIMEMTEASLGTRYNTFCYSGAASCTSDCNDARTKFSYVKGYDKSRREAYRKLSSAVDDIKTKMTTFGDDLISKVSSLKNVATSVNSFVDGVTTIIDQLNCTFLFTDLKNFIDSMCVAFVPALSNVINLVAAGSICFYLAVFTAYMSAMKVSKMETKNKNPVFPANQQAGVQVNNQ